MTKYTLAEEIVYYKMLDELIVGAIPIERSSKWQKVRLNFVKKNPRCFICERNTDLHVHHIKPFHLYPELELDNKNLIVLCETHHLYYGHWSDWKSYNPELMNTISQIRKRPFTRIP